MGTIGFGAGPRPVGAGRVKPRRRAIDGAVVAPPGGGDVRPMRKVGGYSTVGFRATPPIDRKPAAEPELTATERELAAIDRELAAIDRELAAADRELAGSGTAPEARLAGVPEARLAGVPEAFAGVPGLGAVADVPPGARLAAAHR